MAALHPSPPFDEMTYYPISRWIRGRRGADTVVDSRRAVLVWEPGHKTPIYAFPREDVSRTKPLAEIGLDSLMAVELMLSLETRFAMDSPLGTSAGGLVFHWSGP